ncbi:MAG TPA: bifunctional 3,4-dihydroxy-2-butanone-4-phosphate synthase/GTP cyclohydrolase II, partial [Acidimicrobiia bacterium]
GAQILDDLGVRAVRLMTNNPAKTEGLAGYGFEIAERVPLIVEPTADNGAYLSAKRRKLGHLLPQVSASRWWEETLLTSPFFTLAD